MTGRTVWRWLTGVLVLLVLAGCATRPPGWRDGWTTDAPDLARCLSLYDTVDGAVASAGVGDAQWARVEGFPYLRVSRFLASFRDEVTGDAFDAWVARLRNLDRRARAIELANLPAVVRDGLGAEDLAQTLDDCAEDLALRDLSVTQGRAALRAAARVPDRYADWQRVVGLYPLSALPFAWGSLAWRQGLTERFNGDAGGGATLTYRPKPAGAGLDAGDVADILGHAGDNPLGIPEPVDSDLDALFETFAPVLMVGQETAADRIGAIGWQGGESAVDPDRPVAYRLVSHARLDGRVLLQLNYVFWFGARPKSGWFDLLGGHLDGLVWRVTLAPDGQPLLYDSIHPCGCYHLFFPARAMTRTDKWSVWNEGAAEPGAGPVPAADERVVIRLEAGTHYIIGLSSTGAEDGQDYDFLSYDRLRSLALPGGGRKSLFGPSGLVAGTARGERFLFWPMGIASAGAMRQWGTHATAFVGKRHFDDPSLIEDSYHVPSLAAPLRENAP